MDTEKILQKKCMVVTFSASMYTGRKKDKQAAATVAEKYGNEIALGNFTKQSIPAEYLKAIQSNISDFRTYLYTHTLPWTHKGDLLLTTELYKKIMDKQRACFINHENLVAEFLENYESYKTDARARLNGLFNAADYPSAGKVKSKFSWSLDFEPVSAAENFKVDLAENEVNEIAEKIALTNDTAVKNAMANVWQRVFDSVSHLSQKMKDSRKNKAGDQVPAIFKNSIIENIKELCDILPGLNITNDQALEQARQELLNDIAEINPDDLRESSDLRTDTAKKADEILDKIQDLF